LDRCWVQEKSEKSIILMERSPHFIKNVFIKSAVELKMISEKEQDILLDIHKNTDKMWSPHSYIYLRSKPDNCCKKIKKRNRASEKNITFEYIKMLNDLHEETFHQYISSSYNDNVKMTCIDVDGKTVVEIGNEILEILQSHFPSHKYI
jgi:deoxyadenosine/deoxycytidine kinase